MALNQGAVLSKLGVKVAGISGMGRVYAASESDADRMPEAVAEFPCAFVVPGPTEEYIPQAGQHRHTYAVVIQVVAMPGLFIGQAYAQLVTLSDALIELFVVNLTLGNLVNSCTFVGSSGIQMFPIAEIEYPGFEITLRVSEQASATPATGS